MFKVFAASGRGEPWKIFFLCYWGGGSKIALGRGTVFWRVSLRESLHLLPPLAHLWLEAQGREATLYLTEERRGRSSFA